MRRLFSGMIIAVGLLLMAQLAWQLIMVSALAGGSSLEYLGEGGSYTIDAGKHFIVKRKGPFVFSNEPGPSYSAAGDERVWAATMNAPSPVRPGQWLDYGSVSANCEIAYTAIDDDVDDRINVFYVDGHAVHEMSQGMVTGGRFKTPESGKLRLLAADSIGIWVSKCKPEEPSPTLESTPTSESSATPVLTETPTSDHTPTPGPSPTATDEPAEPTPTVTKVPATATKKPRLPACLRINFELSGGEAREGIYEVRELGGRLLYTWYAQAGWRDSGWIYDIDISFEDVYIEVFYVPDNGPPIRMKIFNPAPGTPYGWLTRGQCHALEIGWPDETITPTATPDAYDGFNDAFDRDLLDLQRFIWPDIQPTPSPTPASSLRG